MHFHIFLVLLSITTCRCTEDVFDVKVDPVNEQHKAHMLLFDDFKEKFGRNYPNQTEHDYRFEVFKQNLNKIELFNRYERGTAKYGLTKWTDVTEEEFTKFATGLKPHRRMNMSIASAEIDRSLELPETFDWRDHDAVSEVKDQGFCGSCWAFSTTGNIEGVYKVKKGVLYSLSEEELVECDKLDNGCDGGYMTNAYQSVMNLGGLETEADYPYKGIFSDKCKFNPKLAKVNINSYVNVSTNEDDIARFLVQNGPVSIGINAAAMQFYLKGIAHPWRWACSPKKIDHGVLIVGYGFGKTRFTKKTLPYWIVKNSWGASWGRHGYYYVYRGDGTCGLNTMVSSAVVN